MPIFNPRQALYLLNCDENKEQLLINFLEQILPFASEKIASSFQMKKIHCVFFQYIMRNIKMFIKFFDLSDEDMKKFYAHAKENVYKAIYDIIHSKKKDEKKDEKEDEKKDEKEDEKKVYRCFEMDVLTDKFQKCVANSDKTDFPNEKIHFFVPFSNERSKIFITDHSLAVLSIEIKKIMPSYEFFFTLNLASFIIAASGHTLVLSAFIEDDYSMGATETSIFEVFDKLFLDYFSEIHIFGELRNNCEKHLSLFKRLPSCFVYIYLHGFGIQKNDFKKWFSKYDENPYIKYFIFSKKLKQIFCFDDDHLEYKLIVLNDMELSADQKNSLPINLCNAALFSSDDRKTDYTPKKISGIGYGKIEPNYFGKFNFKRIPIIVDNEEYFVEFDDLHIMNPELYITDPMYLTDQDLNISIVETVKDTYKNNTKWLEKHRSKNSDLSKNIEDKMHNVFHYIHKYTGKNPYTSQIFAVYQAIDFLSKQQVQNGKGKSLNGKKGVILQVHTGEGKSLIVQALAEQLALQGKIVHVATSNIILAARDFMKGYEYYKKTSKKNSINALPSILLHDFELEHIKEHLSKQKDTNEITSFYSPDNFNNKIKMNISVCLNDKKLKSNIVYSTFLNFESFYLIQNEKNPSFFGKYMDNCYLIIDEADTILIDELKNGTILSKPMRSNARKVLEYIYDLHVIGQNDKPEGILNSVKNRFPECKDMTIDDVKKIFSDIEKALSYKEGSEYLIRPIKKNDKNTYVIPFDSKHKGILELGKEFSGFIHQLIGIKERKNHPEENESLVVQPLSMNYSFISHPTYIMKYKGVCGVTGTIGNKIDKGIMKVFYKLDIGKVPRHQMNLRKDLPAIMCNNIQERDKIVCQEIINFHKLNYPVLVIFNNTNEIKTIKEMLVNNFSLNASQIAEFDGTSDQNDSSTKKKLEEESGKSGTITLGTNFCGRGVSINFHEFPLCVIVTYNNEDNRSILQALGRAGRDGHLGITRLIYTRNVNNDISPNQNLMSKRSDEFDIKNERQLIFIDEIRESHPWIFSEEQFTERMPKDYTSQLRNCRININRITAYKYDFPICMSLKTFFEIQAQRIFSIKNCPECKYTWNLFRIYMRELILESWSIFVDKVDRDYDIVKREKKCIFNEIDYSKDEIELYKKIFNEQYKEYTKILYKYIDRYCYDSNSIFNDFMKIYNTVVNNWEDEILNNCPLTLRAKNEIKSKGSYTSYKMGFYPMCLAENSGFKISSLTEEEKKMSDEKRLYILDPELKYLKIADESHKIPFSITKIIDSIYNKFQETVDKFLQGLFGVRFFLRRTLGGCEFGVCVDPLYECKQTYLNCLVDTSPIIMLTICTKSTFFWIAGFLMIILVFTVTVFSMIATNFLDPAKLGKSALDFLKNVCSKIFLGGKCDQEEEENGTGLIGKSIDAIFEGIIKKLKKMIHKNIENNEDMNVLVDTLINLFIPSDDKISEKINESVFAKFKVNDNLKEYVGKLNIFGKLIKIGIMIVILIGTFIWKNFRHNKSLDTEKASKSAASSYQKEYKEFDYSDACRYSSYNKMKKIFIIKSDDDDM